VFKNIDRTYRTNPQKFGEDLTRRIVGDANLQMATWETQGHLPLFIRVKNLFVSNKVVLRGGR